MKWWIFEDALRDRKGHWSEYLQTFRLGLEAEGDEVCIFADRECEPALAKTLGAEPFLPKSIWARMSDGVPRWRRLLRIPSHGFATYRTISKLLSGCSACSSPTRRRYEPEGALPAGRALPDLIFVPTILGHHQQVIVLVIDHVDHVTVPDSHCTQAALVGMPRGLMGIARPC